MAKIISKGMTIELNGKKYIVLEIVSHDGAAVAYCQTPTGKRIRIDCLKDTKIL